MSDFDWPALSVVAAALLCVGLGLNRLWRIWPVKDGEIRLPRTTFGGAMCALTVGVWLVAYGLYLQAARHDTTGVVPVVFSAIFLIPASLVIWRWLAWRLWVEATGVRQRRWLGKARLLDWGQIAQIKARYFSLTFVVETIGRDKITLPLQSEGAIRLLDAALHRSIPLVDFERFEKQGWIRLPASDNE